MPISPQERQRLTRAIAACVNGSEYRNEGTSVVVADPTIPMLEIRVLEGKHILPIHEPARRSCAVAAVYAHLQGTPEQVTYVARVPVTAAPDVHAIGEGTTRACQEGYCQPTESDQETYDTHIRHIADMLGI